MRLVLVGDVWCAVCMLFSVYLVDYMFIWYDFVGIVMWCDAGVVGVMRWWVYVWSNLLHDQTVHGGKQNKQVLWIPKAILSLIVSGGIPNCIGPIFVFIVIPPLGRDIFFWSFCDIDCYSVVCLLSAVVVLFVVMLFVFVCCCYLMKWSLYTKLVHHCYFKRESGRSDWAPDFRGSREILSGASTSRQIDPPEPCGHSKYHNSFFTTTITPVYHGYAFQASIIFSSS